MSKFDFSHLNVSNGRTAKLVMHQISVGGNTPYLVLKPATDATKAYYNHVLKRSGKNARQVAAGAINAGMIEENRKEDRELYPLHIIIGWGYEDEDGTDHPGVMPDAEGADTKFSPDACRDFINALPNWLFDDVRQFAGNPLNFVDDGFDPEVAAKNSQSG